MSWIEWVLMFVLLGVFIGGLKRFGRPILQVAYAFARLPCHTPRYRPGVARMMPAIMIEPVQYVRCTLWKLHDGHHECAKPSGEVERWTDE